MAKRQLKRKAILLRKRGLSYAEIQEHVPVSKSTLSLWLRSIELTDEQKRRLERRCERGRRCGAAKRRSKREQLQQRIYEDERKKIGSLTERELWLMGAVLYWAEGAKEKPYRPGSGVKFMNSDPVLIRLFLEWILRSCRIARDRIRFSIYIHDSHRSAATRIREYWSRQTGFPRSAFHRVYYKSTAATNRRNRGRSYFGVLRVEVKASSKELRMITGWILGVGDALGGGVIGNTPAFGAGISGSSPGPPATHRTERVASPHPMNPPIGQLER